MIKKIFRKRTHVMPYKNKWMVRTFNNVIESFMWDLKNYGLDVALFNVRYLLRGE